MKARAMEARSMKSRPVKAQLMNEWPSVREVAHVLVG